MSKNPLTRSQKNIDDILKTKYNIRIVPCLAVTGHTQHYTNQVVYNAKLRAYYSLALRERKNHEQKKYLFWKRLSIWYGTS